MLDECDKEVDAVSTGVPLGSLIYPLLFLMYTVPFYGMMGAEGLHVTGFVDGIIIYTKVDMVENACRLSRTWKNVCEWATSMHTEIDLGKNPGFIYFNKKRRLQDINDISLALFSGRTRKNPTKKWNS